MQLAGALVPTHLQHCFLAAGTAQTCYTLHQAASGASSTLSSRGASLSLLPEVGVEGAGTVALCTLPALLVLDMGLMHTLACSGSFRRKWLGYGKASNSCARGRQPKCLSPEPSRL